ncbi:MAG TPA: GNAT family N-acetyltransferase [Nocardioidaceae bacterium]|nr:GNAT family N-acetyltransferase [Nocardioidaceae bacterium]
MRLSDIPSVAVLLTDGGIATVRGFDPADADAVRALHRRASDDSIYRRFFALNRQSGDTYVQHLCAADPAATVALVAEVGGEVVAVAGYECLGPQDAEVAFFVDDRMQGKGMGTILLEHLAAVGRRRGIRSFRADVLAENHAMIRVFRDAGFDLEQSTDYGMLTLTMSTSATERAVSAADARERAAEARSLRPLLNPAVVAVAGAGRRRGGVGREVLENIRAGGFTGRLYAIHPEATDIGGVPAYADVGQLPEPADLVVVAVPADRVLGVVDSAGAAGTRAAVVITAGLGERGGDGATVQHKLVRIARRHGMRLVGPNCLGVLNADPDVRLDATFATLTPPAGGLAIASQSGGVGIALIDAAAGLGVGVANFVSLGNKADVSGNDLLAAWTDDSRVRAAALYLESFGNPRKFARLARRFAERKPLLAVVGGRSAGGRRAGLSHTAAAAAPSVAVDALCARAGVIAVRDLDEMVDAAHLLVDQPLPAGRRFGIVGNAGGIGVLAADAAQDAGLVVPELSTELRGRMDGVATASNPVDLGAAASPEQYIAVVRAMLESGEVDSLLVVFAATRVAVGDEVLAALADVTADFAGVPVAAVLLGLPNPPASIGPTRVPVYRSAEDATVAVGHATRYAEWRLAVHESGAVDATPDEISASFVRTLLADTPTGRWLAPSESRRLLDRVGISAPAGELAQSADEAAARADCVGYPVVVKAADPSVVHRTDRGLVRVGLRTADDVREAYAHLATAIGDDRTPVLVQRQVTDGVEIAVGAVRDPTFGPLVMVAAGGIATEVWDDRAFLLPPVTVGEADQAIRSLRVAPLLLGHRGSLPVNLAALAQLVSDVSRLATDVPELAELDLNPVIVTPDSVHCVDAKVRLAPGAVLDEGVPRRLADPR